MGPAEEVYQPVETSQLTAILLFPFGKGWSLDPEQVINWGDHPKACEEKQDS